ncbi:MAG: porin [Bacteroidia bacterium]
MSKFLYGTFIIVLFLFTTNLKAKNDSLWNKKPSLVLSGFLDIYYVYDFNKPKGNSRQTFLYNHNRHNEFNLNLGLIKLGLENSKYRANLALQTGTYTNDNYAEEPAALKSIFEANVGISLNKKNNFWLDAGILPSYIGFESAISADNLTLTRSLLAENSPYFLSGAKLSYSPSAKWNIATLVVNGWQRIKRLKGNTAPSFGTQFNFSPTNKTSLNWNTFIGTDDPDASRRVRYFNNFFGVVKVSKKINLIAAFDIGAQQKAKNSDAYTMWMSPIFIMQYAFTDVWKISIRAEYYQDEKGVIISPATPNGFQTVGASVNVDYSPNKNIVCRLEGRYLNSKDHIFEHYPKPSNSNFIIAASIAIKFEDIISPIKNN